jgi:hypothetical protein
MSKNPPKQPAPDPATPQTQADLPVVVSFGFHKKSGRWVATALQSQGMRILKAKVLEVDSDKAHVMFCLERTRHEYYSYGYDPFAEEGEA